MEESPAAGQLRERLAAAGLELACPLCKGTLGDRGAAFACGPCRREYPVVAGIPDFRLQPDRFIGLEEDRRKGLRALDLAKGGGFEAALDAYWSITPELAPDLAVRHHLHQLRETEIGEQTLREMERLLAAAGDSAPQANGVLLDLGCGTGGLLAAAGRRFSLVAGVDVAFRWLLVGRLRLREAGVDAALICANAEYLPFAPARAGCVTANDLLEHVADPAAVLAECRRVTASGGHCYLSTNNRYSLAPEPHVQVWGVGFLARGLQARYVQAARGHSYRNLGLLSGTELRRFAERAGLACGGIEPAPLFARHLGGSLERLAGVYNSVRLTPLLRPFLGLVGPRVQAVCRPR